MSERAPTAESLFTGIGGFDLALEREGFVLGRQVELDAFPVRILERRFSGVARERDVRAVGVASEHDGPDHAERSPEAAGGRDGCESGADLLVGGFPCQDLSVAGKRAGLGGGRSSLFWEIVRLAGALRPRVLLLENVPGLLSSCSCRGCRVCARFLRRHQWRGCGGCAACATAQEVIGAHHGTDLALVGAALANLGYHVGYRILDSRFFGVAQRRRRVYLVASLEPEGARAILFDGEGGERDLAAGHEAGAGAAAPVTRSTHSTRNEGQNLTVGALGTMAGAGSGVRLSGDAAAAGQLIAFGGNDTRGPIEVAAACNAHPSTGRLDFESETFLVAPTLGSADGGQHLERPMVVSQNGGDVQVSTELGTLAASQARQTSGDLIAAPLTTKCGESVDRAGSWGSAPVNAVVVPVGEAVAFRKAQKAHGPEDGERWEEADAVDTLDERDARTATAVASLMSVRRLTPLECERLQGFPDGWTCLCGALEAMLAELGISEAVWRASTFRTLRMDDLEFRCRCTDSARYRALGNAVTVDVVQWWARRIRAALSRWRAP